MFPAPLDADRTRRSPPGPAGPRKARPGGPSGGLRSRASVTNRPTPLHVPARPLCPGPRVGHGALMPPARRARLPRALSTARARWAFASGPPRPRALSRAMPRAGRQHHYHNPVGQPAPSSAPLCRTILDGGNPPGRVATPTPPLCAVPVAPVAGVECASVPLACSANAPSAPRSRRRTVPCASSGRSTQRAPIPRAPTFATGDRRHRRNRQTTRQTGTGQRALFHPTASSARWSRSRRRRSRDRHSTAPLSAPLAGHRSRQPHRRFDAFHTARRLTPCGSRRGPSLTLHSRTAPQSSQTWVASVPRLSRAAVVILPRRGS